MGRPAIFLALEIVESEANRGAVLLVGSAVSQIINKINKNCLRSMLVVRFALEHMAGALPIGRINLPLLFHHGSLSLAPVKRRGPACVSFLITIDQPSFPPYL